MTFMVQAECPNYMSWMMNYKPLRDWIEMMKKAVLVATACTCIWLRIPATNTYRSSNELFVICLWHVTVSSFPLIALFISISYSYPTKLSAPILHAFRMSLSFSAALQHTFYYFPIELKREVIHNEDSKGQLWSNLSCSVIIIHNPGNV